MTDSDEKLAPVIKMPFRPISNKLDREAMDRCHAVVADSYLQIIADAEEVGVDPLPMIKQFSKQLKNQAK